MQIRSLHGENEQQWAIRESSRRWAKRQRENEPNPSNSRKNPKCRGEFQQNPRNPPSDGDGPDPAPKSANGRPIRGDSLSKEEAVEEGGPETKWWVGGRRKRGEDGANGSTERSNSRLLSVSFTIRFRSPCPPQFVELINSSINYSLILFWNFSIV